MNLVFKIALFSLILNLCTGLMLEIVPQFKNSPAFTGGLPQYNETYTNDFTQGMSTVVSPGSALQPTGQQSWRLFDMMNIGFIWNFAETIKQYIFGLVNVLEGAFGGMMSSTLRLALFGGMRTFMIFAYIMSLFTMWTTREVLVTQ